MAWHGVVTDAQWERIRVHLPPAQRHRKGGRPRLDDRRCFEGILWVLWTGAPWSALPARYGSKSTVHRRLAQWTAEETLLNLWRAFLAQLSERQQVRWDECFIDGTFIVAKKGGLPSAPPSAARERSSWYWPMARVLRSEFPWRRLPPRRRRSSRRRSTASR